MRPFGLPCLYQTQQSRLIQGVRTPDTRPRRRTSACRVGETTVNATDHQFGRPRPSLRTIQQAREPPMTAILAVAVPADARSPLGGHGQATRQVPTFRPPPPLEPRYDDELSSDIDPGGTGLLPFDDQPWPDRPEPVKPDRQRTLPRHLPDPRSWSVQFLRVTLEILAGRRPADQLPRWASAAAIEGVRLAAQPVTGRPGSTGTPRRAGATSPTNRTNPTTPRGPKRPARASAPARPTRPAVGALPGLPTAPAGSAVPTRTLHSVHVTEPADGVAEVCAVVRQGERYQALAARLEAPDGRWRCVSLRLL